MNGVDLIGRNLPGITDREGFCVENWPDVDEGGLNAQDLEHFHRRKQAVLLYLSGASHLALYEATGFQARYINHTIRERCMHRHPDGQIYGWRALFPGLHIVKYARKHKVKADHNGDGTAGALGNLLELEPYFAARLQQLILKTCPDLKLGEIRRPRHALWGWFLKELRGLGYEARNEWPFTVSNMGYSALIRYADRALSANPVKAARIVGGPELQKKMVSGDGIDRPVHHPFERVEMVAHKLDGRFVVMIPQAGGGWSPRCASLVPSATIGMRNSLLMNLS